MSCRLASWLLWIVVGSIGVQALIGKEYLSGKPWDEPKRIAAGTATTAPSDAIVLFDGKDMSAWNGGDKWLIADGVATVKGGGVQSKQSFGDCQLHLEWASPAEVKGTGQGRGNSGVYLMGRYEVQILDSYNNTTYFDGQCAAIYKQRPPLVNASRMPGEWQSYDIIFTAPRFKPDGSLQSPAFITVLHNGVLVQNHFQLEGATAWDKAPEYTSHPDKLPIQLQDHGNPVKFRNIWVREL